VEQLDENVGALRNMTFTSDELVRISAIADAIPKSS
jgi:aryl-alcohol dehydrogenase-like predicted oxidoreductase